MAEEIVTLNNRGRGKRTVRDTGQKKYEVEVFF